MSNYVMYVCMSMIRFCSSFWLSTADLRPWPRSQSCMPITFVISKYRNKNKFIIPWQNTKRLWSLILCRILSKRSFLNDHFLNPCKLVPFVDERMQISVYQLNCGFSMRTLTCEPSHAHVCVWLFACSSAADCYISVINWISISICSH